MRERTFLAESGLENSFPKSCNKRNKCKINIGQHFFSNITLLVQKDKLETTGK